MAIKSIFTCVEDPENCNITTEEINEKISISLWEGGRVNEIHLDIHTAVKFCKTLSSEIRKAKNK